MKNSEEKKNILFLLDWYWIWWTEKTAYIYMKSLIKEFGVFSASVSRWWPRFHDFQMLWESFIANWNYGNIIKFIKKNKINILYLHMISQHKNSKDLINFLSSVKELGVKIIETSPFSIYTPDTDAFIDFKFFVSKWSLLKFLRKYKVNDKTKYNFLYNPLDIDNLSKYIVSPTKKQELRKRYGIDLNDFVIWKVWRADLWKWDDAIIDVLPYLIKKIPNIKVVIRAVPKLKKWQIKKKWLLNYFIFLPETVNEREISETYQIMDVMLHTSFIWESFWIALAEWMFFWLPVFSMDTNWMDWTLYDRDNSQWEILGYKNRDFVDNDCKSLSDKIYNLYLDKNLMTSIWENNRDWTIKTFSSEVLKQKLIRVINDENLDDFCFENELEDYIKRAKHTPLFFRMYLSLIAIFRKCYIVIMSMWNTYYNKNTKKQDWYSKNDL